MNPGADRLPGEVLEKIFSYLPCEDLVKRVQFVCTWWQQVSWEKSLWKHVTYKPSSTNKSIVEMLEKVPQLQNLNLRYATVNSNLFQFITDSCPHLECLHICWDAVYSNVTITRPLRQIKTLNLFWPYAESPVDFSYLDNAFPNLESLNIGSLSFHRKYLETYLQKKQNTLHTLSIPCHTLDKLCVLPCLSVCTKLRNLCLYEVCRKEMSFKEVGHLPNISHLTLINSSLCNVNDSSALFCSFPNITELVLHSCRANDNFLGLIAHNCPRLQKVTFSYSCIMFVDRQLLIEDILQHPLHVERLSHLNLYHNASLTDESIEQLRLMPHLIHLDLYGCVSVTTRCLKLICGFNKLEVLKFDLFNGPLPADLRAGDVKNKTLQLMFYNCRDVSSLESLRRQHLRVCLTGYSSCGNKDCSERSSKCQTAYCTCWTERYDCFCYDLSLLSKFFLQS